MTSNINDYDLDLYEIRLSCGHKDIKDIRWISTPIETRFSEEKGTKEDYFYCDRCGQPSKYGGHKNRDFCRQSVLHPVVFARKLTPLEKRMMVGSITG
jgi:hypothetical protein